MDILGDGLLSNLLARIDPQLLVPPMPEPEPAAISEPVPAVPKP